jgi:hypothetical protein
MTDWPFTNLELTAGLRRYLADPTLRVMDVIEEPVPVRLPATPVRGVGIDVERHNHAEHYSYMVTEPRLVRLGLAGAGRRETGFLRSATFSLPIALPELVAADPYGAWVILEPYPPIYSIEHWSADDYRSAVLNLAGLQDRYWRMDEDLAVYPWMAFPLTKDFETVCLAAARAVETIMQNGQPEVMCGSMEYMTVVARLLTQADSLARVLLSVPQTLLHGDYWPGNISIDEDRRHVVYDWQTVSVGPGILDLATFVIKSQIHSAPLPVDVFELVSLYRYSLAIQVRQIWSETEWQKLWDYALMWRFLQEQLSSWADPNRPTDLEHDARIEKYWLAPVAQAAERWLEHYTLI